jgi:hypothetical protein
VPGATLSSVGAVRTVKFSVIYASSSRLLGEEEARISIVTLLTLSYLY